MCIKIKLTGGKNMKKSSFVAMILGVISGIFIAIGMCMALLPEWNAFTPGVVLGCVGLLSALITVFVWRKMTNKAPIKLSKKTILTVLLGIVGALTLGVGMSVVMVWSQIIWGIIVGLAGILLLLCLIPICKGLK